MEQQRMHARAGSCRFAWFRRPGRAPDRGARRHAARHSCAFLLAMWNGLPDLNALLTPVLTWAITAITTIAAIILIWSIYEN